jgi:hypothetical protein
MVTWSTTTRRLGTALTIQTAPGPSALGSPLPYPINGIFEATPKPSLSFWQPMSFFVPRGRTATPKPAPQAISHCLAGCRTRASF